VPQLEWETRSFSEAARTHIVLYRSAYRAVIPVTRPTQSPLLPLPSSLPFPLSLSPVSSVHRTNP
jgi:hypothetical protein